MIDSSLNSHFSSQDRTPILTQLQTLANTPDTAFYAPGHKRGQGVSPLLASVLGKTVFQADLPELPQLDNLFAAEGVIQEAQILAAEAFGAEQTWFLVNGSTCGIIAAILATCPTNSQIILPRNIHQSAIAGLILSGATPIFIYPEYNAELDLAYGITPEALETTLQQHPDAQAVMVVYPTYHGICCDLEAIAQITHRYNLPLLVDEAHGAHFTFHPDLPPSALSLGADLTIQSTHKVLGAMTQASMLHLNSTRVDPQRINKALQLLQSTSPSYLLLASLDGARQQIATQGGQLLNTTLQLANRARTHISRIAGLSLLDFKSPQPGFKWLDRTRLTVIVEQLGISGYEVDEILCQQFHVTAELPMLKHITFIISIGNTDRDINNLIHAFQILSSPHPLTPSPPLPLTPSHASCSTWGDPKTALAPPYSLSPRDAFFSPTKTLPVEQAINCISAELICPYPPGIPVLMPGELITSGAILYLQKVLKLGASITGCSDSSLQTLKVLN